MMLWWEMERVRKLREVVVEALAETFTPPPPAHRYPVASFYPSGLPDVYTSRPPAVHSRTRI